jgi:hypothetical protein
MRPPEGRDILQRFLYVYCCAILIMFCVKKIWRLLQDKISWISNSVLPEGAIPCSGRSRNVCVPSSILYILYRGIKPSRRRFLRSVELYRPAIRCVVIAQHWALKRAQRKLTLLDSVSFISGLKEKVSSLSYLYLIMQVATWRFEHSQNEFRMIYARTRRTYQTAEAIFTLSFLLLKGVFWSGCTTIWLIYQSLCVTKYSWVSLGCDWISVGHCPPRNQDKYSGIKQSTCWGAANDVQDYACPNRGTVFIRNSCCANSKIVVGRAESGVLELSDLHEKCDSGSWYWTG